MKLSISIIILSIIGCLCFASCDEWQEFETIDFKTTGAVLVHKQGTSYSCEVPVNGGEITFTAIGKNAYMGFLAEIEWCEFFYDGTHLEQDTPLTLSLGDCGKVEVLSRLPHITRIVLKENNTGKSINGHFSFGGGYTEAHVYITQLGR